MLDLCREKEIFSKGFKIVAGVDEAGRGPLAGPVVASCVVVNTDFVLDEEKFSWVRDSKKLSEKRREELFSVIQNEFEVGVGISDHHTIDRVNILQATFLAMKKAISDLKTKPDFIILDGRMIIPNLSIMQKAVVGGDNLVFSIAAASIIAKVTRDRMMMEAAQKYPEYGFEKHKGYGTKVHMEALQKYGACEIHRKSFGPVKKLEGRSKN